MHDPTEEERPAPRLLVAEDNPANQRLIEIILSSLGYRLSIVDDGRKAVQAVEAEAFDLVLMDLRMPVLDGFEAARRIRKLEGEKSDIPILAVTADVRPRVEADVLAAGMNGCLFKPIDVSQLTAAVASWAGAGPRIGKYGSSRSAYSR
jgi:CheY-like chemotaxis protein